MRFFSRPASGRHSAGALSASHEPPGRSGASTNSQARHRAISASKLPLASQRVAATPGVPRGGGGGGGRGGWSGWNGGEGVGRQGMRSWCGGIISVMSLPFSLSVAARRIEALLGDLSRFPWKTTAQTLRERFRADHLGLTASSLTFTTILALVPFFTVALAVFTAF